MSDEAYLLSLPVPPGDPAPYNIGDGELLHRFEEGRSLVHSIPVLSTDTKGLACYVEVSGGSDTSELRVGAVHSSSPPPLGKFEGSLPIGGSTIFRVSMCPLSRCLIVSEPVADVKLLSAPLPSGDGPWVLAFVRKDGYIRIFDCERSATSHWDFPTVFK
jgi:hypothetical protein